MARVVESAPVLPLCGSAAMAAALFGVAVLAFGAGLATFAAVLGLGVCASCAAYVLDEEAAELADATPTSRPRRMAWRMLLALMPLSVAAVGLAALSRRDPGTRWPWLAPVAIGMVAVALAGSAFARRRGMATPGDLCAVLALAGTLLVAVDPFRRWLPLMPLDSSSGPGRSAVVWSVVVALCVAVVLISAQDPGAVARGVRSKARPAPELTEGSRS
jgi:hypothetical protein